MSYTFIDKHEHVARKKHQCDAYCAILDAGTDDVRAAMTDEERAAFAEAEKDGGFILPGQRYVRTIGICEGDFCCWKARPEMDAIYLRLRLYPDD